ncbi:MAG: GTPase ObgE [Halobacteriovoraceae bacterium]|nr:GTPase ObgE [Peredibacter sp.]MBJ00124.1 GTPase ObgE [Halobacteriovoraceae bacterium]|tara:strand:+ start:3010 stop:4008 length:999 start_codon:yes stop_codon:yes gene_type:complete
MKFIDEVKIEVSSGKGGNGVVHFRREKFVPFGGPDGGNGGRGGNVYIVGDENINTLMNYRGRKQYNAPDGENGKGSQMDGATGEDLYLKVPVGTLIFHQETEELLFDIVEHEQKELIAQGGRGGLGNAFFKSATNQAPRFAQEGEEGVHLPLKLELKLIADIALIGLPNAGKSTLISSISAAKPKIADYPFTTLTPNLGVVKVDDDSLVVADIPGLIEQASEGKGLGIQFLKHIERTSSLVHLVDCSMLLDPYEALDDYATVKNELLKYKEELGHKPEIVCLTKIDAMTEEEISKFQKTMEETLDKKVLPISSVSGRNLDLLKRLMLKTKAK